MAICQVLHLIAEKLADFKSEVDGMATLDASLERSKPKAAATRKSSSNVTYRIDVKTGKRSKAGTDSNVTIFFSGEDGTSDEYKLDDETMSSLSRHQNKFERGQVDVFEIEAPDVGTLKQLCVRMDGSGFGSDWLLHSVTIHDMVSKASYKFPCNKWLDKTRTTQLLDCKKPNFFSNDDGPDPYGLDEDYYSSDEETSSKKKAAKDKGSESDDDEDVQVANDRASKEKTGKSLEYENSVRKRAAEEAEKAAAEKSSEKRVEKFDEGDEDEPKKRCFIFQCFPKKPKSKAGPANGNRA